GVLAARVEGDSGLTFDAKLMPIAIGGLLTFNITEARGMFRDMTGGTVKLDADVALPEVRRLALRLSKGPAPLGAVSLVGTFSPSAREGRLVLEVSGIDRQIFNIAGAKLGADFNTTTLRASNVVEFTQGGQAVSVKGQTAVDKFSMTHQGRLTPAV